MEASLCQDMKIVPLKSVVYLASFYAYTFKIKYIKVCPISYVWKIFHIGYIRGIQMGW